uniref:Uncharacterized protein n=1 Tax=Clandestinovirus TaxID=2831644 RepID=A0A8F8PQT5_9VIRU|nr:hypothetical protein KOM_12_160 [Clandestinovirus]
MIIRFYDLHIYQNMSRTIGRVALEGLIVGATLVPIGLGVSYLMWLPTKGKEPFGPVDKMAMGLAASGFAFHVLAELSGVNKRFCVVSYQ